MPTILILLFTIFIMVTVIPYAFSSVIKQLEAVRALEAAGVSYIHIHTWQQLSAIILIEAVITRSL